MSHIYQPAMLRVLLENKGTATLEQVASHLLSYDQSQVEYYGVRTKVMVGKVLTSNGVVEPIKEGRKIVGYRLTSDSLTEALWWAVRVAARVLVSGHQTGLQPSQTCHGNQCYRNLRLGLCMLSESLRRLGCLTKDSFRLLRF